MPECSGVLVGSGGGQERRVRVVGAAGDVAHCIVNREDAAGRQVAVKLVERRRRECRADRQHAAPEPSVRLLAVGEVEPRDLRLLLFTGRFVVGVLRVVEGHQPSRR